MPVDDLLAPRGTDCASYTRQEIREGAMKAINREYFYIDYRRAIDTAKYKIHVLNERINKDAAPTQEKKEFSCPRCKAQWTTMEVLDNVDFQGRASGFLCKTCDHPLDAITGEGETLDNDDTPAKFNKFFQPLLKLMQQIDEVNIPAVEGQDALAAAVELPRDQNINPAARHEAVPIFTPKPTAVKGMATGPTKVEVSIATSLEYSEAARLEEQERQAQVARQNLLPEWHTQSTVTGSGYAEGQDVKTEADGFDTPNVKIEAAEVKKEKVADLDDVFARLEAERRDQEAKEQAESDDEEDEGDEFEDVPVATPSVLPDAKRVKLEPSAAPSPANLGTPAASTGNGGEESDEDEFEDVS
jgi:transcription initiation factor TFIIE subunit alpha